MHHIYCCLFVCVCAYWNNQNVMCYIHVISHLYSRHNCCKSSFQLQTKDLRAVFVTLLKQQQDGAETIVHMLRQMCFSGKITTVVDGVDVIVVFVISVTVMLMLLM
jgi:hypothetical protein